MPKRYYLLPKAGYKKENTMENKFSWSSFIGILAMVAQGINFAFMIFGSWFVDHTQIALILTGVLHFIQAVTGRVQKIVE